jgi:superfamily I DNA and/or RNA helicase
MNYPGTKTRFEVRNIEGPIIKNNINEAECEAIISELKTFIEYLKYNPKTNGKICTIGILAFYNGQVVELRKKLQQMFNTNAKFNFRNEYVHVALNSVDRFQGQEADVIYLSMVQNDKVGFLDSISRVNVAITRAKEQIIIFGDAKFFKKQQHSEILNKLFKEVK